MANVKISALPSTTATTFNDWVIKNDSGETTTSKVQLKDMLGMTSLNGNDAIQSSSWLTSLGTTASTQSAIAIGNGAEATSPYSIAIGHQALNQNRDGGRDYYICIGFDAQAVQGATAFGRSTRAIGADSVAIGISATAAGNGSFALGNSAFCDNANSVSIGSSASNFGQNVTTIGSNASNPSGNENTAIGYISQTSGADKQTAVGYDNRTSAQEASAFGSSNRARGIYSTAVGRGNDIFSAQTNAVAIGVGNFITGGTSNGALGENNIVTHTEAFVIGKNQTSLYTSTTHVDNLYVDKVYSFNTVNAGTVAGSIDVDLSLGSLFFFSLSGDVAVNFTNWREGQKIQFWVDNLSNWTVTGMTITGLGDVYAKGGSVAPTNNEITGYYGTIVNGNMFLDEHLNFQVV
jgi:hypothetical protein